MLNKILFASFHSEGGGGGGCMAMCQTEEHIYEYGESWLTFSVDSLMIEAKISGKPNGR